MKAEYPRDVDPSITGQPHQVTGEVPDLMGNITRTLGNSVDVSAAAPATVPPQPCSGGAALKRLTDGRRLPYTQLDRAPAVGDPRRHTVRGP